MKKFVFSLERVLDYKEQIEESLRNEHSKAVKKVTEKENDIKRLEYQFNEYKENVEKQKEEVIDIIKLREFEKYMSFISAKIAQEKKILQMLKNEEELAREKVIEAKKDTSSIQMLKDKKRLEYNMLVTKAQEQAIEEFVSNRSMRV